MLQGESKAKVIFFVYYGIFLFIFDIKKIIPDEFINPKFFYIYNFQANTNVALKI